MKKNMQKIKAAAIGTVLAVTSAANAIPAAAEDGNMEQKAAVSKTSDYISRNLTEMGGEMPALLSLQEEKEKQDIRQVEGFDQNGLAATYHYVTLDYTLVDQNTMGDNETMDDVWENAPESVIAMYTEYSNVYEIKGNDDYLVAFLNPGGLNGMNLKSIYADFTDDNIVEPEIYNGWIQFDETTGIAYIPKAYYYDENGQEVLRPLIAQTLVPYSFDEQTANQISVTVEDDTGIVGNKSMNVSANALDVDFRIPLASKGLSISQDQIQVYLNDELLPLDAGSNYGYDSETGCLIIGRSALTSYSIRIKIQDRQMAANEEKLEREVLVASNGDLSGILLAADDVNTYDKPLSYAGMTQIPSANLKVDYKNLKAGQLYKYKGLCTYYHPNDTAVSGSIPNKLVKATYSYCYYGIKDETVIYNAVMNNELASLDSAVSSGLIGRRKDLTEGGEAWKLFNVAFTLPNSSKEGATYTSTDGQGTTTWTSDLYGLPNYPEGFFNQLVMHCAHPTAGIAFDGNKDSDNQYSNQTLWTRCLYVSEAGGYSVWAFISPTIGHQQAGCGIYKVYSKPEKIDTYVKMGMNKKDDEGNYVADAGYLIYPAECGYDAAGIYSLVNGLRKDSYDNAKADLANKLQTKGMNATYVKTDAKGTVFRTGTYNAKTTTCFYVAEFFAPSGYDRDNNVYKVEINPNENADQCTIKSVEKGYDGGNEVKLSFTAGNTYVTAKDDRTDLTGRFYVRKKSSDGTEIKDKSGFTFTVYESMQDAKDKKGGKSSTTIASGSTKDWFEYSWKATEGSTKTVYVRETAISASNSAFYYLSNDIYEVTMTGNTDKKKSTITAKKYTLSDEYAKGTDVAVTNNNASEYVYYEHANSPVYVSGQIEIQKVDENNKPLDGVVFDLYSDAGLKAKITAITTKEGKASYVIPDQWKASDGNKVIYVKENEAAAVKLGLIPDTNTYKLTISGNADSTKCTVSFEKASGSYTPAMTKEGNAYTLKAVNKSNELEVDKTDLADGKPVIGATLSIFKADASGKKTGNALYTWQTDGTTKKISRIPEGTYVLSEEGVPGGYLKAEEQIFTVSKDGQIQKLTMTDDRPHGQIEISKKNEQGNPLANAVFTVFLDGKIVDVLTTDQNGYAVSKELPIDERGEDGKLYALEYVLKETKAPEGYVLENGSEEITFSMTDSATKIQVIHKDKVNKAKQSLPATGGIVRMAAYTMTGLSAVLGAVFLIAGFRKKHEKKKSC